MPAAAGLSTTEPVLRTLAPALRELENGLRGWLTARHPQPLTALQRARLSGLADDLARHSETLQQDQPLLVVILMGGTGVGKSTLLNALAGASIAQASFARPTTRDPVVYLHEAIPAHRLDPALQVCKLAGHDRPALRHKILVDTPDLDSNDLANRERLFRLLPVADVVLYVGSQEKYHDQQGWDLFLEQKKRRAFAFILNKWDRCQRPAAGASPDEDWLRDLRAAGFEAPLLFRTCAQHWVEHPLQNGEPSPAPPVPGEQFAELVRWLEQGLSRLEIEAIKARGVGQLLGQLDESLTDAAPPDVVAAAQTATTAWRSIMAQEADEAASLLVSTLDPYEKDIEGHFAERRRQQFTGLMAWYLGVVQKVRNLFLSGWRPRMPWQVAAPSQPVTTTDKKADFHLAGFVARCSQDASERHLDSRQKAFANRLLLEAEKFGMPLPLLSERVEPATRLDWRQRRASAMLEVLTEVERAWAEPTGPRYWLHATLIFLGNTLPSLALLVMVALLLWQYMVDHRPFDRGDVVLPIVVMILTMVVLHTLTALLLPMRWPSLRAEFHRQLRDRTAKDLADAYIALPSQLAEDLLADRKRLLQYQTDVRDIARWLGEREQAATVQQLFG